MLGTFLNCDRDISIWPFWGPVVARYAIILLCADVRSAVLGHYLFLLVVAVGDECLDGYDLQGAVSFATASIRKRKPASSVMIRVSWDGDPLVARFCRRSIGGLGR